MDLKQLCQNGSHFFYSKYLDLDIAENFKELAFEKINPMLIKTLLPTISSSKRPTYVYLKTNKGDFLFCSAGCNLTHDQILSYLQKNEGKTYFFSNNDDFSYGAFGLGEKGKIVRYLSVNSELDDEHMVKWIGTPHLWEKTTHTIYTKEKLINGDMLFAIDEVCDMTLFYLPFLKEDIEVIDFRIYSDKKYIKTIIDHLKIKYKRFDKSIVKKVYSMADRYDVNNLCIALYSNNLEVILSNQLICSLQNKSSDKYFTVLSSNLQGQIDLLIDTEHEFYNSFIQLFEDMIYAKEKENLEIAGYIKKLENSYTNRYFIITHFLTDKKFTLNFYDCQEQTTIFTTKGSTIPTDFTDKIFKFLKDKSKGV